MAKEPKTTQNNSSVDEFVHSLQDDQTIQDCKILIKLMQDISGHEPKMWGTGIVGFNTYHYTYESGREGDCQPLGFHPAKGKITIYLMDGTEKYAGMLASLGKHSTGKVCLYIKTLSDVDLVILRKILTRSYTYITSLDGSMQRA